MIAFRCDSSFLIGSGHILRRLNLADGLKALGFDCCFFLADLPGQQFSTVEKRGFKFQVLPHDADSSQELSLIQASKPDWLIVDHYQRDRNWESLARKFARVFVIDDLLRVHDCDAYLDPNFRLDYIETHKALVPADCPMFLGPGYSLLPRHYVRENTAKKISEGHQKTVLSFFGGTDPTGESVRFYEAVSKVKTQCRFTLVVGQFNHQLQTLLGLDPAENCEIKIAPANWEELLETSDFYFGSGGSVTWERFFFGLPGIIVTTAANQSKIASDLYSAGLTGFTGEAQNVDYRALVPIIEKAAWDASALTAQSAEIKKIVEKIPDEILKGIFGYTPKLTIRNVSAEDALFLFTLRNLSGSLSASRNQLPVDWSTHLAWFENVLKDPKQSLYIAMHGKTPVGQFRVNSSREVSVSLVDTAKGKGFGAALIRMGSLKSLEAGDEELTAIIKAENLTSQKSFQSAGYVFHSDFETDGQKYNKFVFKNN